MIIGWLISTGVLAQKQALDSSASVDKYPANNPFYVNSYHLQPVLIPVKQFLVFFNTDIPHYYKWYSPETGKPEKLSSKMVINEINFNARIYYGLTSRLNIFLHVPVRDMHYYSPIGMRSGIGLGDLTTGILYDLISHDETGKNDLTAGLTLGFPTGKYKNINKDKIALGEGSYRFKGNVTGLHRMEEKSLIYSFYYEYLSNHSGYHIGDETGAYILCQIPVNTSYGYFGIEPSLNMYWKFKNTNGGETIPNSEDYAIELALGGWYQFINNLYLRVNVPFTLFRNDAWMTRYNIMLQVDYLF